MTSPSPLATPTTSKLFRPISATKQWQTLLTPPSTTPSRSSTPSTTSSRSIPRTPTPPPPSTPIVKFRGGATEEPAPIRHVTPVRNATFVTRPPPQALSSRSDALRPRPAAMRNGMPQVHSHQHVRETTDLIADMHDLSFMLNDHVNVADKARSVRGPGFLKRVLRRFRPGRHARQRERATAEAAAFAAARAASGRVEVVFEEDALFDEDCWSESEFRRELRSFAKRNGTDIEPRKKRRWRGLDRADWRGHQSSGSSLGLSASSVTHVSHGSGFN